MFRNDNFNSFVEQMSNRIDEREKVYGDTWKTESTSFLEQRLFLKLNEFKLTKNPRKLISLANLAMLLYVRILMDNDKK